VVEKAEGPTEVTFEHTEQGNEVPASMLYTRDGTLSWGSGGSGSFFLPGNRVKGKTVFRPGADTIHMCVHTLRCITHFQ
jgi:hypothetical protein